MRVSMIVVMTSLVCAAACGGGGNDNESPKALIGEGVYDVTLVQSGTSSVQTGSVSLDRDTVSVFIRLADEASIRFSGLLEDRSTLHATGDLQVTDYVYPDAVDAEATFSEAGGEYVVTGSFVADVTDERFNHPVSFTMHRPVDADAGP